MTEKTYQLSTLTCPTCVAKIEKVVNGLTGVEYARVLFNSSKLKVAFNSETGSDTIAGVVAGLGYEVLGQD